MLIFNDNIDHLQPLMQVDRETLGVEAAVEVERFLSYRDAYVSTPLRLLPQLAQELGVGEIAIKDEGHRLGLGSFKALGGSYAVIRLVVDEASRRTGRQIDIADYLSPDVRAVAQSMTVTCATDGNHGRSVAQGAQIVGAKCVIFVHAGVTKERADAIARYGAEIVWVDGTYDGSVAEASRVAQEKGWVVVSDTSWPGYEHIPGLVMQGYTALLREALRELPQKPTHVFIQAGVGGVAAAVAGHFSTVFGEQRPTLIVVEPSRAACVFESAKVGHPVKIQHGQATVMAMLECYEPSLVAWRVLSRAADAFMTVDEEDALAAMRRLAFPLAGDPAIVAGESGGVGLAGLTVAMRDPLVRTKLRLDKSSRVFLINTEGATDPHLYESLIGVHPSRIG